MNTREDLTHYSDDELSLRVFNDEYLYTMRNRRGLFTILEEQFIYSKVQRNILIEDIAQDNEE
jgi:uncharacterized protein Smg (DUF494 family)